MRPFIFVCIASKNRNQLPLTLLKTAVGQPMVRIRGAFPPTSPRARCERNSTVGGPRKRKHAAHPFSIRANPLLTGSSLIPCLIAVAEPCTTFIPRRHHAQLVELKNGETYNGHLINCDTWMNLHLKEVLCTSKVRCQYQ